MSGTRIIDLAYRVLADDDRAFRIVVWRLHDHTWSEIAHQVQLSERHVQRIHAHALLRLSTELEGITAR